MNGAMRATLAGLLVVVAACGTDGRLARAAPSTGLHRSDVAQLVEAERDPLPVRSTTTLVRASRGGRRHSQSVSPTTNSGVTSTSSVVATIHAVFGPAGDAAVRVARCESGLRPGAVSSGGHAGLFQLARVHAGRAARLGYAWSQMLEAYPNTRVAFDLWREQGWRPWACGWAA